MITDSENMMGCQNNLLNGMNRNSIEAVPFGAASLARCVEMRAAVRLYDHPHLRMHGEAIQCCFRNGRLSLAGQLPSYYLKQLAQEVLRGLEHVDTIDNHILVAKPFVAIDGGSFVQRRPHTDLVHTTSTRRSHPYDSRLNHPR